MSLSLRSRSNWTVPPLTPEPDKETIKKVLRGIWSSIQQTAAWFDLSKDIPPSEKNRLFGSWIRDQVNNLPCASCIPHGQEYIRLNPPEQESPSVWCWRYHNSVNRRLGKPEMEWNTYKEIYLQGRNKICESDCGE